MWGSPSGSDCKESACNAGDLASIPGSCRTLGEGNGYPFQYSCLENPMGKRSLEGYSPWVVESDADWATNTQSLMWEGLIQSVVLVLSRSNCLTLFDSKDCRSLARLLCPWHFPGKNTGVGYCFLLQRIFPTHGPNLHLLCLLHCRWILYPRRHWASPPNQLKGWIEQKHWVRGNSSCLTALAATLIFFHLQTQNISSFVGLKPGSSQTRTHTISSPSSQAFELGLNCTNSSPVSILPTADLSLHNCISQFLNTNKHIIYLFIHLLYIIKYISILLAPFL